jgi:hypothetical protein
MFSIAVEDPTHGQHREPAIAKRDVQCCLALNRS